MFRYSSRPTSIIIDCRRAHKIQFCYVRIRDTNVRNTARTNICVKQSRETVLMIVYSFVSKTAKTLKKKKKNTRSTLWLFYHVEHLRLICCICIMWFLLTCSVTCCKSCLYHYEAWFHHHQWTNTSFRVEYKINVIFTNNVEIFVFLLNIAKSVERVW